jgi:hypothetical protein
MNWPLLDKALPNGIHQYSQPDLLGEKWVDEGQFPVAFLIPLETTRQIGRKMVWKYSATVCFAKKVTLGSALSRTKCGFNVIWQLQFAIFIARARKRSNVCAFSSASVAARPIALPGEMLLAQAVTCAVSFQFLVVVLQVAFALAMTS